MDLGNALAGGLGIGALSGGLSGLGDILTGTKSSVGTFQNLTPQQQQALADLIAQLKSPGAVPAYGGQLTAAANPLQQSSLAAMEQASLAAASPTGPGATSAKALTDIIGQTPQDLTSYFKTAFVDPAMQQFQQVTMPALEGQFKGMAGYGSDFATAAGRAAANVQTGIASQEAQAVQDALQRQQDRKLQAAMGLPQSAATDVNRMLALQAGGGVGQATAQQPLTAAYQEFQRQQGARQTNIQDILAALGVQTTTPVVTPGQPGLLQGLAQGAGQGIARLMSGG